MSIHPAAPPCCPPPPHTHTRAQKSIALPDVHSGYGFAIGNVAAFDMSLPEAVVSPGGVGFDINCGVRLIRTNLSESDVAPVREQLAQVRGGDNYGSGGGFYCPACSAPAPLLQHPP